MAKKKEKVEIVKDVSESKNLEEKVIGIVDEKKNNNPLPLIILFVILICFAFALPYITDYIAKKKGDAPIVIPPKNESKDDEKEKENPPKNEITFYDIKEETAFTVDNIKFSSLKLSNITTPAFSFVITNMGKNPISLKQNNYYFEFYSEGKTMLERVKLNASETINSATSNNISLEISKNTLENAKLVVLSKKSASDFPNVTLKEDDEKVGSLACIKGQNTITYTFKDSKLHKINDVYMGNKTDEKYSETLNSYRLLITNNNNINGVKASIAETASGFTANTLIDLEKANLNELKSSYYFAKDTLAKVVSFEMQSMNYKCN